MRGESREGKEEGRGGGWREFRGGKEEGKGREGGEGNAAVKGEMVGGLLRNDQNLFQNLQKKVPMSNFAAWPCNCRIPWLDSRFRVIFVGILNFLASAHPSIPRGMPRKCDLKTFSG